MGAGLIVRNTMGEVIASSCNTKRNVSSTQIAETRALWTTINMCLEIGLKKVVFEGDAKQVVEAINNSKENWTLNCQIIEDINILSGGSQN